jgi:5-dehydro-2-deoxygluconokinase
VTWDVLAMGRSSIDLYSQDIGAPFTEITGFAAYVGGCATNVSVGTRRLGLQSALLTAVGEDPVGDFVLAFLQREGVETRFIPRKPGRRTSAVVLGIEPPDRFPLVFYRDNCADIALDIDDVLAAPVDACRALFITGTGLSREPSRSATVLAAQRAHAAGASVYLDVDFRPDQWDDVRGFGLTLGLVMPLVDVLIGTEDEVKAAAAFGEMTVTVTGSQVSDSRVSGDVEAAVSRLRASGVSGLVLKRGLRGASVYSADGVVDAAPFPVEVLNTLGAGDAFASGLIYARLQGWDWHASARFGNAVGAIVVTRPACANSMPSLDEVNEFLGKNGAG